MHIRKKILYDKMETINEAPLQREVSVTLVTCPAMYTIVQDASWAYCFVMQHHVYLRWHPQGKLWSSRLGYLPDFLIIGETNNSRKTIDSIG